MQKQIGLLPVDSSFMEAVMTDLLPECVDEILRGKPRLKNTRIPVSPLAHDYLALGKAA